MSSSSEQSLSCGATRFLASYEIRHIIWVPEVPTGVLVLPLQLVIKLLPGRYGLLWIHAT